MEILGIIGLVTAWYVITSYSIHYTKLYEKADPLAAWKPKFDPSGAKYTYILSNVSHPAIEGIAVGYRIRDKVWERSGGRLYVDFRPLAQLGGEKEVISKLKLGAVQGMLSSSVAAANVADKLDKFRNTPELFDEFRKSSYNFV